ncbi:MAG: trypsin-like serine peptidase, partial [Flavobacteriales bacterium]
MKKNLLAFLLAFAGLSAIAQLGHGGEPSLWSDKHLPSDIPFVTTPAIDRDHLAIEDAITDQHKDVPYRFGVEHEVVFTTSSSGIWRIDAENDKAIWQLGIECPGALSVSIRFSEFSIPKGGNLFIWSAGRDEFIGSFDHRSNSNGGSFATGLIHSDKVVVELEMPISKMGEHLLAIDQIVHGYRSFLKSHFEAETQDADRGPFGDSGNCEVNVNCPEGADWQVEKRSVAIIVEGGFGICTGALVNNTANDGTPYFLTANHCTQGSTVSNWTFYFNHESATCSGTSAPTNNSISGSTLKANNAYSDFALLLLDETPPANFDVEYAGWDATDSESAVSSAVCIHHPSGDIKKISFEEDAPYHDVGNGAQVWWIDNWELGVTEPGSSGSPLFNQDHRIIGQLFGGASACSGNNGNGQFDFYGRFGQSWDHSASNSAQLQHWLDPGNTGVFVLNGYPEGFVSAQLDAS